MTPRSNAGASSETNRAVKARRGPYANGVRRREELLDAAFAVFAEQGYRGSSVRVIAQKAGTSHAALLHHFGSKYGLLQAVLTRREEIDRPFREDIMARLGIIDGAVEVMRRNARFPGLIYLDATLSAEAIDPDHPAHGWYEARFQRFMQAAKHDLQAAQASGRIRPDLAVDTVARQLLALINGLQVQWLYDPDHADMARHVGAFLTLLTPLDGAASAGRRSARPALVVRGPTVPPLST